MVHKRSVCNRCIQCVARCIQGVTAVSGSEMAVQEQSRGSRFGGATMLYWHGLVRGLCIQCAVCNRCIQCVAKCEWVMVHVRACICACAGEDYGHPNGAWTSASGSAEGIRWCCVDPCAIGACTVPRTDHASQCVAHCDPLFVLLSGSALELALFSPITRVE